MRVWILWTRQACGGAGTAGATRVEVCPSDRWARLGAPHHGFMQACYSYEVDAQGGLTEERWEFDTDEAGWPPAAGSWALKLGPYQVAMLQGCLTYGGWHRRCGWKLHRNLRKTELVAERLAERGLLRVEPRIVQGERVALFTVEKRELCEKIINDGGVLPREALGEVNR